MWGGNSGKGLDSKRHKCALTAVGVEATNCHGLEWWVSYWKCRFGAYFIFSSRCPILAKTRTKKKKFVSYRCFAFLCNLLEGLVFFSVLHSVFLNFLFHIISLSVFYYYC